MSRIDGPWRTETQSSPTYQPTPGICANARAKPKLGYYENYEAIILNRTKKVI